MPDSVSVDLYGLMASLKQGFIVSFSSLQTNTRRVHEPERGYFFLSVCCGLRNILVQGSKESYRIDVWDYLYMLVDFEIVNRFEDIWTLPIVNWKTCFQFPRGGFDHTQSSKRQNSFITESLDPGYVGLLYT